ncbi:4'-phosphopantetheinyl transferase family protein [Spirosoma flavum]|uniref:4'-phosphopantetheinyl transferase family protein n=1 Tax=Spirosoma flavum TaxID=2048557 RepID=A0ABW6AII9_9BACT
MPVSTISCASFQDVSWLHWADCSYDDEIAIFRFPLVEGMIMPFHLKSVLQPDEIHRSQRYYREEDRQRFLYTRSILRVLSGSYTNQAPEQIRFTTGMNKKPELVGDSGWRINVSHSGKWILLTIGKVSVGIDVEKNDPKFSFRDMLSTSFSRGEQDYIEAGVDAQLRFYQLWTRKEALIKATGKGMDDDFWQVPSLDGSSVTDSGLIGEAGSWIVSSFFVATDYHAAIAYRATQEIPKFYTLDSGLFSHRESQERT